MQTIWDIAWHRFQVIQGVVSDASARTIAILFYFTIMVPFGVAYRMTADPFGEAEATDGGNTVTVGQAWHPREAVPNDMESARRQG
ncbi:MAG: hypothetical protein AAFV98_02510 [Chloroflexota bacterium]